jgi:hypothetical protein
MAVDDRTTNNNAHDSIMYNANSNNNNSNNSSSRNNNILETRSNTPIMDFDDWGEDPFTDVKDNDVFAPFHDDVVAVDNNSNTTNKNINAVEQPSTSSSSTPSCDQEINYSNNRKRSFPEQTGNSNNHVTDTNVKQSNDCMPFSRRKKKPKGMPKRPLSAYNLYFQAARSKILVKQEEAGDGQRIGFEGLGKIIGKQWRDLNNADKKVYEKLAEKDSERYRKEMETYNEMKAKRFEEEDKRASDAALLSVAPVGNAAIASLQSNQQLQSSSLLDQSGPTVNSFPSGEITAGAPSTVPSQYKGMDISQRTGIIRQSPATNPRPLVSQSVPTPPASSHVFSQPHNMAGFPEVPSFPGGPPPAGNNDGNNSNNFPLPPGMEIVLSDSAGVDRKYRVHYTCYSMTREAAHQYLESLTGNSNTNGNSSSTNSSISGPLPTISETVQYLHPSSPATGPPPPPVAAPSIGYNMPPLPPHPYGGGWRI